MKMAMRSHQAICLENSDRMVSPEMIVDATYYRTKYPDVRDSGLDPQKHYQLYGCKEAGRYRNLEDELDHEFDAEWYEQHYADVTNSGLSPREHYIVYGYDKGRYTHAAAEQLAAEALAAHQMYLDIDGLEIKTEDLPSIAVHLHLNSIDHFSRVEDYLRKIPSRFDLYCSYSSALTASDLKKNIKELSRDLHILQQLKTQVCDPSTSHLTPLFTHFTNELADYPCVCHLHTDSLSFPCEWLYTLQEILPSREGVLRILDCLTHEEVGIIFPEPYFRHKLAYLSPEFCTSLPTWRGFSKGFALSQVHPTTQFCSGGMFWCRGDTLHQYLQKNLIKMGITKEELNNQSGQFWERILSYVPLSRGKNNYLLLSSATRALRASDIWDAQEKVYRAIFNPEWYVHKYHDVAISALEPEEHFRQHGREEGRRPCVCFPENFLRFQLRSRQNAGLDESDSLTYCQTHFDAAQDYLFANVHPRDFHIFDGEMRGLLSDAHRVSRKEISLVKSLKISIIVLLDDMQSTAGLLSCASQTVSDVEILIVNGSGVDATAYVHQCLKNYSGRVRIIETSKDSLLTTATTQGIDMVTGDYICFLHSRDRLVPDFCAAMGYLAKHYDCDAVMCETIMDDDGVTDLPRELEFLGLSRHNPQAECLNFTRNAPFAFTGLTKKIFRRATWKAANCSSPWRKDSYFDDILLLEQFATHTSSVLHVENTWYHQTVADNVQPVRIYRDALVVVEALSVVCDGSRLDEYLHALLVHRVFPLLRIMAKFRSRYVRSCLKRLASILDAHAQRFSSHSWNDICHFAGEIQEASLAMAQVRDSILFVDPIAISHIQTDFPTVGYDYIQCTPEVSLRDFLHRITLGCTCTCVVASGAWSTEYEFRTNRPIVQLWHGIGLGKNVYPLPAFMRPRLAFCSGPDCVADYAKLYGVPRSATLPYGSIVTDRLLDSDEQHRNAKKIFSAFPEWRHKKVYLWCPTFRGMAPHIYQRDCPSMSELSRLLFEDEVFLVKYHPALKAYAVQPEISKLPHVQDVSDQDIIELMSVVDVFMTDFSSSLGYAMLLNKKICCLITDLHEQNARHGTLVDYRTWDIPVITEAEPQTIVDCLRNALSSKQTYDSYRKSFLSSCDGHSVPRIAKAIYDVFYDEYLIQSLRSQTIGVAA